MHLIAQLPPDVFKWIGVVGFTFYVSNYVMLTLRILDTQHALYFGLNLAASTFVLFSLMASFNLASALIQFFWIIISAIGIITRLRQQKGRAPVDYATRIARLSSG